MKMIKKQVSHVFDWWLVHDRLFEFAYASYAELGCTSFGLPNTHMLRFAEEPDFADKLKKLNRDYHMHFDGAHAHWSEIWDPNTVGEENRRMMMKNLTMAIEKTAEFEAGVLTIHPGYSALQKNSGVTVLELRQNCIRTMEELLPLAEKRNVKIALENNISPADTIDELIAIVEAVNSPYVGVCYDSGHAHEMSKLPGKNAADIDGFTQELWKNNVILGENNAVDRLAPYIIECHLHDNDGLFDQHRLPGEGTIDWEHVIDVLKNKCPRLECVQNEAPPCSSKASIPHAVEVFRKLWEER